MIAKRISTQQARANFADVLGSVYYTKNPIVVERKGKPFAVVISPDQYEILKRVQEKAWVAVEAIQKRNQDKDPDQVLADVTEVVEEVRRTRYDQLQKKTAKSSY